MKYIRSIALTTLLLTICCWTKRAAAEDYVDINQWQFAVAVGYGQVDNPRSNAKPITTYVLPSVQYYGERFYLDNFTLGYSLFENDTFLFDLQSRLNEDGLFFELDGISKLLVTDLFGIDTGKGPGRPGRPINYAAIERNVSYLAGGNFTWISPIGDISLGAYQDVTGVHHGNEWHLRYKYTTDLFNIAWGVEFGITQKSYNLVKYYYYLRDDELQTARTKYKPHTALNGHLKLVANKRLAEHWTLISLVEYDHLGSGIADSPLIEKNHYLSGFIGVSYAF